MTIPFKHEYSIKVDHMSYGDICSWCHQYCGPWADKDSWDIKVAGLTTYEVFFKHAEDAVMFKLQFAGTEIIKTTT